MWRSNTTSLLAEKAMVLTKQHVSAYLEAIIRFTSVGNMRLAVWLDVEISSSEVL
jgi:hypothetical protein